MSRRAKAPPDPLTDPDVPAGMSLGLLQELHLLTREGHLNQDARRKLKQIRHFVGLLRPALDDVYGRAAEPVIVDFAAGKSYLGFLLYELVVGPAGRGQLCAVEVRSELVEAARQRAARFGHDRFRFAAATIGALAEGADAGAAELVPERVHVAVALHACDTATDEAIALAVARRADYIAVVPCCQAQVARQLGDRFAAARVTSGGDALRALYQHPLHRRELGSHLTNVARCLALTARGYQVTVTELVGWEHSAKNELLLARRVARDNVAATRELHELCERFGVAPAIVAALGLSPVAASGSSAPAGQEP